MRRLRVPIGLGFWCGLLALAALIASRTGDTHSSPASRCVADLSSYYLSGKRLELRLPESVSLAAGDSVFVAEKDGSLRQIGVVLADSSDGKTQAALFHPSDLSNAAVEAHYLSPPDSLAWAVETLLPPERRLKIAEELAGALHEHQQELIQALQPVVNRSVRDALAVMEQDLPAALERHRPQLRAIAGRDREEIIKKEMLPLVRAEVWPIVRRDGEPLVREVSGELWRAASVWSLAWRGLADKLPLLGGKHRVEEELLRFLDQEAVPIFERHQEDFLVLIEAIVRDVAENDQVRSTLRRSVARAAADPELEQVLNDILHEVVLGNPRFWRAIQQNLGSQEARDALRLTSVRLEPTIRHIGDLVLGTRENGLTPEFNRVLRQQILHKDRRGVILGELPPAYANLGCIRLEAWFSGQVP
jgi:hypothetical protein